MFSYTDVAHFNHPYNYMCLPYLIFVSYLLYTNNPHSILLTPSFLTHSVITSIFLTFIPPLCLLPHPYLFTTPLFITVSSSPFLLSLSLSPLPSSSLSFSTPLSFRPIFLILSFSLSPFLSPLSLMLISFSPHLHHLDHLHSYFPHPHLSCHYFSRSLFSLSRVSCVICLPEDQMSESHFPLRFAHDCPCYFQIQILVCPEVFLAEMTIP